MYRALSLLIVCALLLGLSGSTVLAQEPKMDAAEVVDAIYSAVEAQDLATAAEYLADDVVLVLVPPPGGMDGTFVGKEEVLGWYESLIANNLAIELSNMQVDGNRVTLTNLTWIDDLPVAPVEFDGSAVVQQGKLKAVNWVMTPQTITALDAAFAQMAQEDVVRRILTEIWSEGNIDLADELVAEDYVSHSWPVGEGREHFKEDVAGWRTDFPGTTIVVDRIVFDGNRAIIFSHNVAEGGSLDTLAPDADIEDVLIYQIENGQLSDRWYFAPFEP
ncbi:MAG: nuclear transport factor 2 family protein [Caldilineaceae bacterium]|jgi:ketosteroid isomerase-like protein